MTALADLLSGEGPPVLQTCRFEGLGGTLYGREAIGACLAALRPRLTAPTLDLQTDRLGVWIDEAHAVIADLTAGQVSRLWLLSDRAELEPLPRVDVPVDPDLAQAAWGVRLEPRDHGGLSPDGAQRLVSAIAARDFDLIRTRPLVLRAASAEEGVAALLWVEGERPAGPATPVGFNALVFVDSGGATWRIDGAGVARSFAADWTPRL